MYTCKGRPRELNDVYECFEMDEGCAEPVLLWAPGAGFDIATDQAALPFGADGDQYMSLQVSMP